MELDATGMAGAGLAVTSFVASSHPAESCGLNGLPLTPHSTAILGAGQLLLTCRHPHLARCRLTLAWCLNTCVPVQGPVQRYFPLCGFWEPYLLVVLSNTLL